MGPVCVCVWLSSPLQAWAETFPSSFHLLLQFLPLLPPLPFASRQQHSRQFSKPLYFTPPLLVPLLFPLPLPLCRHQSTAAAWRCSACSQPAAADSGLPGC